MKKYKINFRCIGCNKLLAKADGDTEIKCPRCGKINRLNADTMAINTEESSENGEDQ